MVIPFFLPCGKQIEQIIHRPIGKIHIGQFLKRLAGVDLPFIHGDVVFGDGVCGASPVERGQFKYKDQNFSQACGQIVEALLVLFAQISPDAGQAG